MGVFANAIDAQHESSYRYERSELSTQILWETKVGICSIRKQLHREAAMQFRITYIPLRVKGQVCMQSRNLIFSNRVYILKREDKLLLRDVCLENRLRLTHQLSWQIRSSCKRNIIYGLPR